MSADLFAAFEDVEKPPPPQGQPPKASSQASPFTNDPFSSVVRNALNTSSRPEQNKPPFTQQWNNKTASWGGQLPKNQQSLSSSTRTSTPLQPTQSKAQEDDDDDDGWGDFEVAPSVVRSSTTPVIATAPAPTPAPALSGPTTQQSQRTRVVRASTMDLMTNNLLELDSLSAWRDGARAPSRTQAPPKQTRAPAPAPAPAPTVAPSKSSQRTFNTNPNVLFDADDFEGEKIDEGDDDDDFGEFETVASPIQTGPDLLTHDISLRPGNTKIQSAQRPQGLNLGKPAFYPQAPRSPSFQERNPFPGLAIAPASKKEPANEPLTSPTTAWPSIDPTKSAGGDSVSGDWAASDSSNKKTRPNTKQGDSSWDWDSEEPIPPQPANIQASAVAPKPKDSTWDWDPDPVDIKTEQQNDRPEDDLPPTNVPPPSILLSMFPQLFDQANTSLYKPVGGQSLSIKNRVLSNPKTIEFLKGYVALATVAARIIAGRKLRWHRDKFLSQRMTISAAGSKGMKLAGVDKTQAAHEDREAADVVANWKEHIGRLRSAVAAANSSIKNNAEQLKIPEISESMQIQTEKVAPTAPKACLVCGLKRNERVAKVDHEVEDSFGEWWVDHWGHLGCKRFWVQHEKTLRQR